MDVSIIIVNYNTSSLLKDCIESIYNFSTDFSFEIIVVDNNSSDDSCQLVKNYFKDVILIKNSTNLGFGKANNIGSLLAKGKYLLLLNTDILLIDNSIKTFFEFMENQSQKVAICGGNLYDKNMNPNFSYSLYYPSLWSMFCYRFHLPFMINNEVFNKKNIDKEVSIIIGADLFVKKHVFDEVGGFDSDYFMYVEEGDLQLRIKKKGYKIKSLPTARFIHYQGASSNTLFKIKEEIKSYKIYFKKHYPRKYYIYLLIEYLNLNLKYIYGKVTLNNKLAQYNKQVIRSLKSGI